MEAINDPWLAWINALLVTEAVLFQHRTAARRLRIRSVRSMEDGKSILGLRK